MEHPGLNVVESISQPRCHPDELLFLSNAFKMELYERQCFFFHRRRCVPFPSQARLLLLVQGPPWSTTHYSSKQSTRGYVSGRQGGGVRNIWPWGHPTTQPPSLSLAGCTLAVHALLGREAVWKAAQSSGGKPSQRHARPPRQRPLSGFLCCHPPMEPPRK